MQKQSSSPSNADLPTASGILYAILAYGTWGLLPIYWKLFGTTPAVEVLCHRIIWSACLLIIVLLLQKRWPEFSQLWKSPRILGILFTTASLLALNWGTFIYGVNVNRVVETSLGYFINPLLSILLGAIFLKEQLNFWQIVAVALATLGVSVFIRDFGSIPWIALGLALTFGSYGLIRKVTPVVPLVGLAVETVLVTPIALILVGYWARQGQSNFGASVPLTLLFISCGLITSLPMLWFNNAAKRLPLSTLGFLQYLTPTLQLLLGVFLYHEPFSKTHIIAFGCIWSGLAIYSTNLLLLRRSKEST